MDAYKWFVSIYTVFRVLSSSTRCLFFRFGSTFRFISLHRTVRVFFCYTNATRILPSSTLMVSFLGQGVVLCVCLLLARPVPSQGTLDYTRVHLVDHNAKTNNFFFRGNMPVVNGSFAYDTLIEYFQKRAKEANVPLPTANFTLVDLSLNNAFDGKDFDAEKAFWKDKANAKYGRFINWPLVGGLVSPKKFSKAEREKMANGTVWKVDKLPKRVVALRDLLDTPNTAPGVVSTFVYVHCTAGCDRTGEMVGSYRMKYTTENITNVYAHDAFECGRPPNYWSTTAIEWFCLYIQENGRPEFGDGCTSFAKCKFGGKCVPTVPNDQ